MANIYTSEGKVAFTPKNCPGFSDDNQASHDQLVARAEAMNAKAAEMGLKTRYEVR